MPVGGVGSYSPGSGAESCNAERAAGLSSQVSVSWVMGLAGFKPPPCPGSPVEWERVAAGCRQLRVQQRGAVTQL